MLFGIGAIIGQLDDEGKEYVIAYASRSNNKAESNYSSYEGSVLLLYGPSYISALSLWHQFHFIYQPLTYQMVDDQRQAYW
jgi:hypothetical protein